MSNLRTLIIFFFFTCIGFTSHAHENDLLEQPLIEVSTSGKASALPDQAELNVTFSATNIEAEKARNEVDKLVRPFLTKLSHYDIEENSLDSSQTQLHPRYEYRKNQKVFLGYQLTRHINFKLNSLQQLEKLIKDITDNKASRLDNINFLLKKPQNVKRQALNNAIKKARESAQAIADGFGVELGRVYKVSHSDSTHHAPKMRMMAMSAEMADDQGNTYQQKEIEFHANVVASFLID